VTNISQLINQSTDPQAKQKEINHPTKNDHERNQPLNHLNNQSANQPINQTKNHPTNKPTKQPRFQPVISNLINTITKPPKPPIHKPSYVKDQRPGHLICT
jgi:hypothetical protein